MSDLVDAFRNRLSNGGDSTAEPTFLFLDALDQLDQADNARWLNWLPTKLAPGVKVVLSVLDDEDERQCYDVATRKWPDRMVSLGQLQLNEGETVLEAWLRDAGRTLQKDQRRRLLCIFAAEGSPLFLKLAFEQARRWRSWERNANVASNVKGLLSDLFTRLDREHGRPTVAAALTYIALAKHGLTEDELMDVLSRDGKVMTNFFAHSPTECAKPESERLKSLPLIIWSRLFTDIERYMNQRRADGTVVMDFYHRQVVAAVRDTYLADEATVQTTHEHLAGYFDSLDYWIESLEARTQRMPPSLRPINVRKVVELPYHRLEAAKIGGRNDPKSPLWNAIAELLTDWEFLEAKAEADPNYNEPVSVNEEAENDF